MDKLFGKKKKKKSHLQISSVFFPPVADWQDFLSTCPTARKTPYLSSFTVDNQQEISPQFYLEPDNSRTSGINRSC